MKAFEELSELAKQLEAAAALANTEDIQQPLKALQDAANQVGRAFSGSWLGYHSRVYYQGFETPPPGANFSREWGLRHPEGYRGGWREYNYAEVEAHIEALAKHPNLAAIGGRPRRFPSLLALASPEIMKLVFAKVFPNGPQSSAVLRNRHSHAPCGGTRSTCSHLARSVRSVRE